MNVSNQSPADGERNAISGYYPQYRLAAIEMLRLLRADQLAFIRMADPNAGRVDDFQVGTASRLDGFQVKWSQNPGSLTLNDLLKSNDNAPSLIRQLADGWMRMKSRNPHHRVVVHLLTNDHPSVQRVIETDEQQKERFSTFLNEAWLPLKNDGSPVPEKFKPAMQLLQVESGLSQTEFNRFVRDCELDFQHSTEAVSDPRIDSDYESDIRALHLELETIVASPQRLIELSRDQLLSRLGWRQRVDFASSHRFPDSYLPYREIESTTEELREALRQQQRGYVALLGDPGSGKSTLLTNTLDRFSGRVIRYYAFVPDSSTPMMIRGEAKNFLQDITTSLDHAGFRVGKTLNNPQSIDQLIHRFHGQMRLIHEAYRRNGMMTLILVDGLDHIQRELKPVDSLLRYLPNPSEVPEGLLFVLGSQSDQLDGLPTQVQQSIRQPDRRIEIDRLSDDMVSEMLAARTGFCLTSEQTRETIRLAAGHPLALTLLVSQIDGLADSAEIDGLLKESTAFTGLIDEVYTGHWRQIVEASDDDDLGELLGKMARFRRTLDLRWIQSWAGRSLVSRLRRKAGHLFLREDANHWTLFHNSFRLFLVAKTAELEPGAFDEAADRDFHLALADLCASQPPTSVWNWETSHHLRAANQMRRLVDETSSKTILAQLESYRSIGSIYHDLRETIRAAANLDDLESVFRLLFIAAEFESLDTGMSNAHFHDLLLDLGEIDKALLLTRDGRELLLNNHAAMKFALKLQKKGLDAEAARVFHLAEPIGTLNEQPQDERGIERETLEELEAWAVTSVHFRAVREIISMILDIPLFIDFANNDRTNAEKSRALQNQLLHELARTLVGELRWDEFDEVVSVLQRRAKPPTKMALKAYRHTGTIARQHRKANQENPPRRQRFPTLNATTISGRSRRLNSGSRRGMIGRSSELIRPHLTKHKPPASKGEWSAKWFYFQSLHSGVLAAFAAGQKEKSRELLGKLNRATPLAQLPDRGIVMLAEAVFRIEGNRVLAGTIFGTARNVPSMPRNGVGESFSECRHIMEFFRAAHLLGYSAIVPGMIPDAEQDYDQPGVIFKRGLSVIGRAWAMAWNGQQLSAAAFCQEYGLLLRLFHRASPGDGYSSWMMLTGLKSNFFGLLIEAAKAHGDSVVQELANHFEEAWKDDGIESWGADHVRAITLHLHQAGVATEWCLRILNQTASEANDNTDQSGRVDWRIDQAAALVTLGDANNARTLLNQIPSVAGGVGYRKDHQMLEWISLLKRINRVDPTRSNERIQFFIRAVDSLIVSSERRTALLAAESLVATVFDADPLLGVTVAGHFVNDGIIGYVGAATAMVGEALLAEASDIDRCIDFIECIIMPMSLQDGAGLVGKSVHVVYGRNGRNAAQACVDRLNASIKRKISPDQRENWYTPLRHAAFELGLNGDLIPVLAKPKREDAFSRLRIASDSDVSTEGPISETDAFTLPGETSLDADQVDAKITSVADMLELMKKESQSSHYDWTPHVERLAATMTADELLSLAPNLSSRWRSPRSLLALSNRLGELNDLRAFEVARMAFEQAEGHGWNPYYDGGDLISAARQLLKLDKDRGPTIVRAAFMDHLSTDKFYTRQIVESMGTVLDLLLPDGGVEGVFPLVESYLQTMFPSAATIGGSAIQKDEDRPNTVSRSIAELACDLLGHATYHGAQCAMEFTARRLLANDTDVLEVVIEKFQEGEDATLDALISVEAAASCGFVCDSVLNSHLQRIAVHRNFSLRCLARKLLRETGQTIPEPAVINVQAIYQATFVLPPRESLIGVDFLQGNGALRDTDDPFAMVGPWQQDVNLVAKTAGISFGLVLSRVVRLMRELEPEDHWNAAAETLLRNKLSNSGLEFVFRSPRPSLARRALFHAIGELIDGGALNAADQDRLQYLLRIHDPKFVLHRPGPRPAEIVAVAESNGRTFDSEWIFAAPDDLDSLFANRIGSRVVIGEWTRHHPKSHRTVTEERYSQLWDSAANIPDDLSNDKFIPQLARVQHDDYFSEDCDHDHLVVTHLHCGYQTRCGDWLAFNPRIARELGWTRCSQGYFAWEHEGVPMVESIQWIDGHIEHRSRNLHGELAEGWLVLASDVSRGA
jgi:hypothetical protein